jgi:putative hemolysin
MSNVIVVELVGLVVLLLLSAFFSGSETALFSIDRLRARRIALEDPRKGKLIQQLISNPRRLLISVLVGNLFVNVLASSLADSVSTEVFGPPIDRWVSIIGMSILVLVVGEITPKTIAVRIPETIARTVAPWIEWEARLVFPIRALLRKTSDLILKVVVRGERKTSFTEEEFLTAVRIGRDEGILDPNELKMIESVVGLGSVTMEEVMRPRSEIIALSADAAREEIRAKVAEKKLSRIPVYEESVDRIFGILYVRDFLNWEQKPWDETTLRKIVREPYFVPETTTARKLVREFRRRHLHMAIVVDEYGGVSGLVTLEDILEEIVGEIVKIGTDVPRIQRIAPRSALVFGNLPIDEFNEAMGMDLEDDEAYTIAGYVINRLGRIPQSRETFDLGKIRFHIVRGGPNRIEQMTVYVGEADNGPANE